MARPSPSPPSTRRKDLVTRILRVMADGNLAQHLEGLLGAPRYKPGPACGVALVLDRLAEADPAAAAALRKAIDTPLVSATPLAATLREAGHTVSPQSVSRHRRRGQHNGCRCAA